MSEELIEQNADIQNDSATVETVDTEQVETQETDSPQEGQEGTLNEGVDTNIPEKIKVGEKEYTAVELQEITRQADIQKAEAEKTAYKPRELEVIEQDIKTMAISFEADLTLFKKTYLAKADTPLVNVTDPETGEIVQKYADFTPEQAFEYGMEKGEWKYFIACLSPQEAINFQDDRTKLTADYQGKSNYFNQEKEYIEHVKAKEKDINEGWKPHIDSLGENSKGLKYFYEKLMPNFGFNKQGVENFAKWYEQAKALDLNNTELTEQTNNAKQSMMSSSISSGGRINGDGIPRTWTSIVEKMDKDPVWWQKNQSRILSMREKGQIK
jgi:hypothetical protein